MDDLLKNWINSIFGGISSDVTSITGQITMTPADAFGQDFWNTILKIGASVVMPFAIAILSYAMAAELYNVYCKANGELDAQLVTNTVMKFIIPFGCITKTYDLLQIMFIAFNKMITQLGAAVGSGSAGSLTDTSALVNKISSMDFFGKLGLMMELMPLQLGMKIMSLVITVVVYGRMIEIVLYWVFAPIPFATFAHNELSQIGKNFIKMFAAVLLQGGFMILCVALYSILIKQHAMEISVNGGWVLMGYSAVLIITLTKTGSMSKRYLGTF
jgi:hypothetical protein